jgi:hypothetical protein
MPLSSFNSRLRTLAVALVALAVLALPATAAAKHKPRDRNHDGIADKWAKKYGLSKKKGAAKKDPDADGLNNLAEFRSHTNPKRADTNGNGVPDAGEDPDKDSVDNGNEARERTNPLVRDTNHNKVPDGREDADHDRLNNTGEDAADTDPIDPDTDGDGIDDGDEGAGRVTAWDGTTLTIKLFTGATLTGQVDEATDVECEDATTGDGWSDDHEGDDSTTGHKSGRVAADESTGDDSSADDPTDDSADDPTTDDSSDDSGDDSSDDSGDDSSDDTPTCSADDIAIGDMVSEASVDVSSDGTFFDAVYLAK